MFRPDKKPLRQLLEDGTAVDEALRKAARQAILRHKQTGNPVVVWRDGKTIWIPADQLHIESPSQK